MRYLNSIFFCILFLALGIGTYAQVGIGTLTPDSHAILELKSANRGLLLPRLTGLVRTGLALNAFQSGLIVYDTDTNAVFLWNGSAWKKVGNSTAGGGVTSVGTGTGLSGGPITGVGSISLANTTVAPGSYGNATNVANFTVDPQGRLTFAGNTPITFPTSVASFTGPLLGDVTGSQGATVIGSGTITASKLAATTVAAGSYGNATNVANFTVDPQGRLTFAGNTAITFPTSVASFTGPLLGDVTGSQGATVIGSGTITASKLAATTVAAGSYGNATNVANFTVDPQGRLTFAGNTPITYPSTVASFSGPLLGDVTGNQGATVVTQIQGHPVTNTLPGLNQVLQWTGSTWAPTTFAGGTLQSAYTAGNTINGTNGLNLTTTNGLLAVGTFGSGAIQAIGAGTRMMWYPAKAAFRAGNVTGTAWDDANIGTYSAAFGLDNIASGIYSFSVGQNNTAGGGNGIAMGFGNSATTTGGNYGVAIGVGNTANGNGALALGYQNIASGNNSVAIGSNLNTNVHTGAMTLGDNNTTILNSSLDNQLSGRFAGGYSFFTDASLTAGKAVYFAPGGKVGLGTASPRANLDVNGPIYIADTSTAPTVTGHKLYSFGGNLFWQGTNLVTGGATLQSAYTAGNTINGTNGLNLNTTNGLLAIGTLGTGAIQATGAGTRMMWYPKKAAFRAGNVTGTDWDDANIGNYSAALGVDNTASGSNSFAVGELNLASNTDAIALGRGNTAGGVGNYQVAIGEGNTASGNIATAIGFQNFATGTQSVAIGTSTTASGANSIAIGNNLSTNNHTGAMALGDNNATVLNSSLDNQLSSRFAGGYSFFTDAALTAGKAVYFAPGGKLSLGTATPRANLDVNGPIYIADTSTAPTVTGHKLYSFGGNLFWQGTNISAAGGANTLLSNLAATTAINSDLTFANNADRNIIIPTAPAGTNGHNLTVAASSPVGGSLKTGGTLNLMGGGGVGNITGGNVSVTGGDILGGAGAGFVIVHGAGNSSGANGGDVEIYGGDGGTANSKGGRTFISGGTSDANNGADVSIVGGVFTTSGKPGNVILAYDESPYRGNLGARGKVAIGSTNPRANLDVNGPIYIADTATPTLTVNKLYSVGGNLFWHGTNIGNGLALPYNASDASPTSFTIISTNPTSNGSVILAQNTTSTALQDVILGITSSTSSLASGVEGFASDASTTGQAVGLQGYTNSTYTGTPINSSHATEGVAASTTGSAVGVFGSSASTSGIGGYFTNSNATPGIALEVGGFAQFDPTTAPSTTVNRLYNVGGTLYFNGASVIADIYYNAALSSFYVGNGTHPGSTGIQNTFIGVGAGNSNTTGQGNLIEGFQAGTNNTTGQANYFVGYDAGLSNTNGSYNYFSGYSAGKTNQLGNHNIAIGFNAGLNNTVDDNQFVGYQAGVSNTTGANNFFEGNFAGKTNTIGANNMAIGYQADVATNNLTNAAAIGYLAKVATPNSFVIGAAKVTGNQVKVGIGTTSPIATLDVNGSLHIADTTAPAAVLNRLYSVGGLLTWNGTTQVTGDATGSLFIGSNGLYTSSTSTANNMFIGSAAGAATTSAYSDVFVGKTAGTSNTTGQSNVFLGTAAGSLNTTGFQNTFIGASVGGANQTGQNNILLGFGADVASDGLSNATAIGFNAKVGASNSLVLGGTGANAVNVGIGTTTPQATLHVAGNVRIADGTQAYGNVLVSDANGTASWKKMAVGFKVEGTTSQIVPGAAYSTVNFDNSIFDDAGAFNLGTESYVTPSNGVYQFTASVYWPGYPTSRPIVGIYVNGGLIQNSFVYCAPGSQLVQQVNAVAKLTAGDLVTVRIYNESTSTNISGVSGQQGTLFSGFKIY